MWETRWSERALRESEEIWCVSGEGTIWCILATALQHIERSFIRCSYWYLRRHAVLIFPRVPTLGVQAAYRRRNMKRSRINGETRANVAECDEKVNTALGTASSPTRDCDPSCRCSHRSWAFREKPHWQRSNEGFEGSKLSDTRVVTRFLRQHPLAQSVTLLRTLKLLPLLLMHLDHLRSQPTSLRLNDWTTSEEAEIVFFGTVFM